MFTVANIVWIVAIAASFIGLAVTSNAAMLVILVCLLAYPIAMFAILIALRKKITVSIKGDAAATYGRQPQVIFEVSNSSSISFAKIVCKVKVINSMTGQSMTRRISVAANAKSASSASFAIDTKYCGSIRVSISRALAFDPLSCVFIKVAHGPERVITIYPQLDDAYIPSLYAQSLDMESLLYSTTKKGEDLSEVFAIREYAQGDPIKRIHWKLSAKTGELVVREPSLPIQHSLLLFWDHCVENSDCTAEQLDAQARVIFAVGEALVANEVSFDLAFDDSLHNWCSVEHVDCEDRLTLAIADMMRYPFVVDSELGLDLYQSLIGQIDYSQIVYVGTRMPADPDAYLSGCRMLAFICSEDGDIEMIGEHAKIPFASDGVCEALAKAGVLR